MKLLKRNILAKRLLCVLLSVIMLAAMVPVGVVAEETSSPFTLVATQTIDSFSNGVYLGSYIDTVRAALKSGGYIEIDASADSTGGAWFRAGVSNSSYGWGSNASGTTYINAGNSVTIVISSSEFAAVSDLDNAWTGIYVQGGGTLNVTEIRAYSSNGSVELIGAQTTTGTLSFLSGADFTDPELYLYVNFDYTYEDNTYLYYEPGALCGIGDGGSWVSIISVESYAACSGAYVISLVDIAAAFESYNTANSTSYSVSDGVVLNLWGGYITFTSAQLVRISSSSATYYTITVDSCAYGSVTADTESATAGATVTLTAEPDEGYELSEWNVTYGDDNTAVTVKSDGTFTMPAGNVTVSATFTGKEEKVETVKVGDVVTVSGIKYTVVATDTDGTNKASGGSNNTGIGAWLEDLGKTTLQSYLTEDALIYVEYTSEIDRGYAWVGLQFDTDGYPTVQGSSTSLFKASSELTAVTFSVSELLTATETKGYSLSDCYQIYSNLGDNNTYTYIYSVSIIVPSSTDGGVCEEISSDNFKLSYVTQNEDGSYYGHTDTGSSYIDVPINTLEAGSTVLVHLTGTTDANFRVWIHSDSQDVASTDYYIYNYSSSGSTFDVWISLTVSSSVTDTKTIRIKGSAGSFVPNMTISHVGIVYEPTSTTSAAHTVNLTTSGKGTITSSVKTAKSGTTVTLTATPETGYTLSSITVNGTEIEGTTFAMPNEDADVVATFVLSGDDDCKNVISMKSSSVIDSYLGSVTVVEGTSITSNAGVQQFELSLPKSVGSGKKVTVHIVGTANDDFRIWLSSGGGTQSDEQPKASELGFDVESGEFDLTFELTCKDGGTAYNILFKGKDTSTNLNNLTLTHVGITYQPSFYGRSLTMDGEIGVTYYFDMTGVTNPEEYVLKTSLGDVTASDETKTISGVTYYRYIVYVSPTQFDTNITATLTDGTTSVAVSDYSVYDYCATVLGTTDTSSELYAVRDICEAVLNYGYYASVYDPETGTSELQTKLAELITGWSDPVANWNETISSEYICASDGKTKSLALDSDGIYVIISGVTSGNTYTIGNETLKVKYDGTSGVYYVEYKVPAKEMYKPFTVYENGSEYTTYSVYTYVDHMISSYTGTDADAVKNLCKAIYLYGQAAASYNGWR